MDVVDGIAMVGEIICWVGLILGVPLLLFSFLVKTVQGPTVRTRLTVLDDLEDRPVALWSAEGRTCSRRLSPAEAVDLAGAEVPVGYVSVREPDRMRLEARSALERACSTISLVMLCAAALGFAASILPLIWR